MRYFLKNKYFSIVFLLATIIFLFGNTTYGQDVNIDENNKKTLPVKNNEKLFPEYEKELNEEDLEKEELRQPLIILNGQKVIFTKQPVLAGNNVWLFPLEEIASVLGDNVSVNQVNRIITVERIRDRAIVSLDLKNGAVTLNNDVFSVLDHYEDVLLAEDSQLVPINAITLFLNLNLKINEFGEYILTSVSLPSSAYSGVIQPIQNKGVFKPVTDYLSVTESTDVFTKSDLYTHRSQVDYGIHNDDYVLSSNLIFRGGNQSVINFDTGNISIFKSDQVTKLFLGDRPLNLIRSPLLGGLNLRGVQLSTKGFTRDSTFTSAVGLLPTGSKAIGRGQNFVTYKRLAEISEWSTSPKQKWQFSLGEAVYKDTDDNTFVSSKQSGGLVAGRVVKTGKYLEGESDLSLSHVSDKNNADGLGYGGNALVRLKPFTWLGLFSQAERFSPEFYPLAGNTFYHDRQQLTAGGNIGIRRLNLGLTSSHVKIGLDSDRPSKTTITNAYGNITPIKNGPTVSVSLSKNRNKSNSDLNLANIIDPITMENLPKVDPETILERRTSEFFRAGISHNFKTLLVSSSYNKIKLDSNNKVTNPQFEALFGNNSSSSFKSYDLNLVKKINSKLNLQNYSQVTNTNKQFSLGLQVSSFLRDKINFQTSFGFIKPKKDSLSPLFNLNLNYQITKRNFLNFNMQKSDFFTQLSLLYRYTIKGDVSKITNGIGAQAISHGKIKGKVLAEGDLLKGLSNIRVSCGDRTVLTDKDGYYEFIALEGLNKLSINYEDIPAYLTTLTPEEVDVKVERGKETLYNFNLGFYGSLSGKIILEGNLPEELKKYNKLKDIRVYLENSEYETLSNTDGSFLITDIKPGNYNVLIDVDFLPEELEIINNIASIQIKSKEMVKDISLSVRYKEIEKEIKEF